MDEEKRVIGSRIKSIRQEKGLTLESFGEYIDRASKGLVGNWEKGVNLPNNKRLKMIANFGKISVNELLNGTNYELKSKVMQYTDEIMNTEIKEKNSESYKELYDPVFKEKAVKFLVNHYDFSNLTDTEFKQKTKKLLDEQLLIRLYEKKYSPSNENAINFACDGLTTFLKNEIDTYFRDKNTEIKHSDYLNSDEIKENLSYELYQKIYFAIENARDEIKEALKK